jgi:hypothetical protein
MMDPIEDLVKIKEWVSSLDRGELENHCIFLTDGLRSAQRMVGALQDQIKEMKETITVLSETKEDV